MSDTYCRATWAHHVTVAGILVERVYQVTVTCGMPQGHDGKHKGWLRGNPRSAIVEW